MINEQNYGSGYNPRGLEGKIVTAQGIDAYEDGLRLSRELFKGQNVLNFGSGGSHLEKELSRWGMNSGIINLDIVHNPNVLHELQFLVPDAISEASITFLNKNESLKLAIHTLLQKVVGIDGRRIIQGDGRNLPFPNEAFDTVIALLSTYQIPQIERRQVFSELLRVGKAFHCAPIGITDYKMLQDLAYEHDYEIVMISGGVSKKENKIFGKTISAILVGATAVMVRRTILKR